MQIAGTGACHERRAEPIAGDLGRVTRAVGLLSAVELERVRGRGGCAAEATRLGLGRWALRSSCIMASNARRRPMAPRKSESSSAAEELELRVPRPGLPNPRSSWRHSSKRYMQGFLPTFTPISIVEHSPPIRLLPFPRCTTIASTKTLTSLIYLNSSQRCHKKQPPHPHHGTCTYTLESSPGMRLLSLTRRNKTYGRTRDRSDQPGRAQPSIRDFPSLPQSLAAARPFVHTARIRI